MHGLVVALSLEFFNQSFHHSLAWKVVYVARHGNTDLESPALKRLRLEDHQFKTSLNNLARPNKIQNKIFLKSEKGLEIELSSTVHPAQQGPGFCLCCLITVSLHKGQQCQRLMFKIEAAAPPFQQNSTFTGRQGLPALSYGRANKARRYMWLLWGTGWKIRGWQVYCARVCARAQAPGWI